MMDEKGETFLDLVSVEFSLPSVAEFNHLRQLVGWRLMTAEATQNALQNSLISCCARRGGELVGYGRFVGDGSMYFYLQDVMIHPEHQGKGIGNKLMNKLEGWLKEQMQYGSTAGLLAAEGKEGFYLRYDYNVRPGLNMGAGMSKTLKLEGRDCVVEP